MLTMVSLMNKNYIAFFKKGDEEKAVEMRKNDPRMKYARIEEILQATPGVIVVAQVYARGD